MNPSFQTLKPVILAIAILTGLALQHVETKARSTLAGPCCSQITQTTLG